jgi:glycosyltransferase involved in cell wall biosynthesis
VIDIRAKPPRSEPLASFHEVWNPPIPRLWAVWGLGKPIIFALSSLPTLNRLLGKEEIDIIHVHSSLHVPIAWVISRLRGRVPVVYAPHNSWLFEQATFFNKVMGIPEIIGYKMADHIIADVPAGKRRLVANLSIRPEKITCIYCGPELEEIQRFMLAKGSFHESNTVLCVAGVFGRKNQLTIVKAVPKVAAAYPDVKFIFAGPVLEPHYFNSIQEFIAENKLSPWVEFRGEVSRDELYNLYYEAAMFVYASLADSQPQVVTEALAFGLPLIASNIEPISDLVSPNKGSSILLNPDDVDGFAQAIISLLRDKPLRQAMSAEARQLASGFSWKRTSEETLALYEKLKKNR